MAVTNRVSSNRVLSGSDLAKQYQSELLQLRHHLSRRESGEEQSAAVAALKQQVSSTLFKTANTFQKFSFQGLNQQSAVSLHWGFRIPFRSVPCYSLMSTLQESMFQTFVSNNRLTVSTILGVKGSCGGQMSAAMLFEVVSVVCFCY